MNERGVRKSAVSVAALHARFSATPRDRRRLAPTPSMHFAATPQQRPISCRVRGKGRIGSARASDRRAVPVRSCGASTCRSFSSRAATEGGREHRWQPCGHALCAQCCANGRVVDVPRRSSGAGGADADVASMNSWQTERARQVAPDHAAAPGSAGTRRSPPPRRLTIDERRQARLRSSRKATEAVARSMLRTCPNSSMSRRARSSACALACSQVVTAAAASPPVCSRTAWAANSR